MFPDMAKIWPHTKFHKYRFMRLGFKALSEELKKVYYQKTQLRYFSPSRKFPYTTYIWESKNCFPWFEFLARFMFFVSLILNYQKRFLSSFIFLCKKIMYLKDILLYKNCDLYLKMTKSYVLKIIILPQILSSGIRRHFFLGRFSYRCSFKQT